MNPSVCKVTMALVRYWLFSLMLSLAFSILELSLPGPSEHMSFHALTSPPQTTEYAVCVFIGFQCWGKEVDTVWLVDMGPGSRQHSLVLWPGLWQQTKG